MPARRERLSITGRRILGRLISLGGRASEAMEGLEPHAVIRTIRNALRMPQAQLAKQAGLPQSHLAKIETGNVDVQFSTLRRIFRAMHCEAVVLPKFLKSPQVVLAGRIKKVACDRMPVRIVAEEDSRGDLEFWLAKPPSERIAAVEFLREQFYALSGYKSLPRLAHAIRLRSGQA